MRSCTVSIQEVLKDPNMNLSAKHWCDLKLPKERHDIGSVNVTVDLKNSEVICNE